VKKKTWVVANDRGYKRAICVNAPGQIEQRHGIGGPGNNRERSDSKTITEFEKWAGEGFSLSPHQKGS